jgi:tRNA modification GTPase
MKGALLQTGIRTVLLGAPNAGKSSLLNILAQRPASIVSPEPGTTRDIVEVLLDIAGFPCVVGDTAGLREGDNVGLVEQEGVLRAKKRAESSDLRILVVDATLGIDQSLQEIKSYISTGLDTDFTTVLVLNKVDLLTSTTDSTLKSQYATKSGLPETHIFPISCLTKRGIEMFGQGMSKLLQSMTLSQENILATNERQRTLLNECLEGLHSFMRIPSNDIVMGAEELKYAANALGKISGKVDPEEVLGPSPTTHPPNPVSPPTFTLSLHVPSHRISLFVDTDFPGVIFADFCIGK